MVFPETRLSGSPLGEEDYVNFPHEAEPPDSSPTAGEYFGVLCVVFQSVRGHFT